MVDVNGSAVTYLSRGGGVIGKSQQITMVPGEWPPDNLIGWLDIDEYYNS